MGLNKNGNANQLGVFNSEMDPVRFLHLAPSKMTLFVLLVSEPRRGFRF